MEWIFVRTENNTKTTENQREAFDLMVQNELNPSWIDAQQCLELKSQKIKTVFFVCDTFSGEAFEHLQKQTCRIFGPKCIKDGIEKLELQNVRYPLYNSVMKGLSITYTGFKADKRKQIMEKIQYMGGETDGKFTAQITHLIADEVGSKKYQVAMEFNTPVMLSDWVFECWKRSQTEDISAIDPEFDKFKIPIFKGLVITLTQADVDERNRIKELVEKNGGVYTGELRSRHATHLIVWKASGKKFIHANQWGIYCVTVDWINECIKKGFKVKEDPYVLQKEDSQPVTSSPSKDEVVPDLLSTSSICLSPSSSTINETYMSVRNSSIHKPNEQKVIKSSSLENLEMATIYRAGSSFLDGCKIFLCGFDNSEVEKIRRIINLGGGTRLNQLSESVSHCVVNSNDVHKLNELISKIESGRWRPKVVKIEWLVDSCLAAFVVDEKPYILWQPSASQMLPPERIVDVNVTKSQRDTTMMAEKSFFSQYLDGISQENKLDDTVDLQTPNETEDRFELEQSKILHGDDNQEMNKLFQNVTMRVVGFIQESLTCLHQIIEENGGQVLFQEDGAQVPDYTIVPIEGIKGLVNVSKLATNVWLLACVEIGEIIPTNSDSLYRPIHFDLYIKPLAGCVLCISQFIDTERESMSELAMLLGATYQDTLVRKASVDNNYLASTHLICKEADGGKYKGAVRWGLPVVSKNWLTDCATRGKWLPEKDYLIREINETETTVQYKSNPLLILNKSISSPNENVASSGKKKQIEEPSLMNNSTSFAFNKTDFSDLKTSLTVKKKNVDISQSNRKLEQNFTPLSSKPKRITDLIKGQNSPRRSRTDSTSSTPSRFLNKSRNFEPKLTFSPDDCPRKPSRDSVGSLEEYCRDNFKSAKDQSQPFGALANVKHRDSGAFFPEDVKKTGPLKGVILGVSKKFNKKLEQNKLNDMVVELGGDYRWTFDKTCTHFVYQGKLTENWGDLKLAKVRGIPIVAPEWVETCFERKERVSENAYPSNYNPKMMLNISVSQIERPPKLSQIDKNDDPEASLVVNKADLSIRKENTPNIRGISHEIDVILSMSGSNDTSSINKNRRKSLTSPISSDVSLDETMSFPVKKPESGDILKALEEPSQSIPVKWEENKSNMDDETQLPEHDCEKANESEVKDGENVQQEETGLNENLDSNKENDELPTPETDDENDEISDGDFYEEEKPTGLPRFMLSGFLNADRIEFERVITSLGGMVSQSQAFDNTCTHLIVSQPSRNEKCLASIVSGVWMLHKSYLEHCEELNRFGDEEEFEWGGSNAKKYSTKLTSQLRKIALSSREWRLKLKEEGDESKPFSKWNAIVYSEKSRHDSFVRVLEAGGAEISTCKYPFSEPVNVTHAFIEFRDDIPSDIDFSPLLDAKIPCLRPEFIASYLMEENPEVKNFYIPEVRLKMNLKSKDNSIVSKRKSNSLNGSNKRNRHL